MNHHQNAKILVRVRPLLSFEDQPAWLGSDHTIQCLDTKAVKNKLTKSMNSTEINLSNYYYQFQKVIQSPLTSQKIYKNEIRKNIQRSIIQDVNSTIVAYGQTCSGKTYTLLGVKQAPGFIPCTFRDIFHILKDNQIDSKYMNYSLKLSYIEIYNQKLFDLFQPKNKSLRIINDQNWGSQVQNSSKIQINSFSQCLEALDYGEQNRRYAEKQNHQRSSRSHTILKIYIEKRDHNLGFHRSVINIIDLAGSERLTDNSLNTKQTGHINKSLFQFSNVISKLSQNNDQYIPYRDSKLTRMLESSLTKNSLITVVFCISPAVLNLSESISTLRLATKAKCIKYEIQQELDTNLSQQQIRQLLKQLSQKNRKIEQLTQKINKLQKSQKKLRQQNKQLKQENNKQFLLETQRKQQFANTKIIVLVDHQNFLFQICGQEYSQQQFQQFQQKCAKIKGQFMDSIAKLYEEYAKKMLSINSIGQEIVRIQEICFLNMCYDRNILIQYRKQMLQKMKDDLTRQGNIQFIKILNRYSQKLQKNIQTDSSYRNNITDSPILEQSTIQVHHECQGNTLYNWGCKKDGRVFKSSQVIDRCGVHKLIKDIGKIAGMACGTNHNIVVNTDGQVYGWGKNQHNQIINNHQNKNHYLTSPRQILINKSKILSVAAGWGHSIALNQYGQVFTWGFGEDGQLGHGYDYKNISAPKKILSLQDNIIQQVYAGHSHSGFIDQFKNYYACGFNKDYRLMLNQSQNVYIPTQIPIKNVIKAALGVSHSCLLTAQGRVFCGGIGTYGELGVQLDPTITGYNVLSGATKNFQEQPLERICPIVQVQLDNNKLHAIDISCGQNFTAIVNSNKQLYTFGKTTYDRLGHNQRGVHKILNHIDRVNVGYRHGFAWNIQEKKVYGWGFNMHNQLGTSKMKDLRAPQIIEYLSGKQVIEIKTGFFHSLASCK